MTKFILILSAVIIAGCSMASTTPAILPTIPPTPSTPTADIAQQISDIVPFAAKITQELPINCTVLAQSLNVRSGPGIEHPAVAWLSAGEIVTTTLPITGWVKVSTGWVNGKHLECEGK